MRTAWFRQNHFCTETHAPGDLILDMDAIVAALTGNKSTHPDYSNVMNTALAVRETIYKSIESGKAGKRAFVITATSDKQQVENLSRRLHGSMHYMDTPEAECNQTNLQ